MTYRWRQLAFEAPEGQDESSILIVDPTNPPRWNLDVRIDQLDGGAEHLSAYVDSQERAKGVVVDGREERKVAGRTALIVEQHLSLEDRSMLRQQQAFVADGTKVVIATMTAKPSARKHAEAAFERLLATLEFEGEPS